MCNRGSFNTSIKKSSKSRGKCCGSRCERLARGRQRPALGSSSVAREGKQLSAVESDSLLIQSCLRFLTDVWCLIPAGQQLLFPWWKRVHNTVNLNKKLMLYNVIYFIYTYCIYVCVCVVIISHACKSPGPRFVLLGKTSTPHSDQFNN